MVENKEQEDKVGKRIKIMDAASFKYVGATGAIVDVLPGDHPLYKIELDDEELSNGFYYFAFHKHVAFV